MSYVFALFPEEFLFELSLYLPLSSIMNLCQTNRRFNKVIYNNDYFWYKKFLRNYGFINYSGMWKNIYLNYLNLWELGTLEYLNLSELGELDYND